jgi:tetratricopeptide (TPR) repeat protein
MTQTKERNMKNQNAISLIALFLFLSPVALLAQTAQDYQDLGNAVYQKGLYAKAVDYYKQAVQANPNDWQSYEDMGDAYMKMNDNSDALTAYQKSLQINSNNSAVQAQVNSLQSSGTTPAQAQGNSNAEPPPANGGQWEESQPTTVVVERRRHPWRRPEVMIDYKDGLAPMNHARGWLDVDLAYNWSNQADLFTSQTNFNNYVSQNPPATGIATADHGGIEGGVEAGFLINPYNGIAIGVRGIQSNPYQSNLTLNNGGDGETINIQPYVVPLTLDYYLFLPDHDGRFFLTAGIGYYFAVAYVDDNYSYAISKPSVGTDEITGNMYGGNVGFQLGIGREFEIGPRMGLRLFARGRYCKITNLNGNFVDANGNYDNYGLVVSPTGSPNGTVGAESTSQIGGNEKYATLDYTGFEFGVGLTFF